MKKSIAKNYIYNLVYQILVIILPVITTPYLARVLGPENLGVYSYVLSITAAFILVGSMGLSLYAQREVAYNQKSEKEYSKLFWELFLLKSITMIISIIVYYILFVFRNNNYNIYFTILLVELFSSIFDISWFFQGLEDFQKTISRNIIIKLLSVILIFLFVKNSKDLTNYFYIYIFSVFFSNFSLWLYLPKILKKIKISELKMQRHLKPIFLLFIPQIAIEIYTVLDRTMLGVIISDKSEVGFYDQSQKIIKLLLALVTSLGLVMLTRVSNMYAEGNHKKVKSYILKSFNVVFFLGIPMIFGLISISEFFVPIFFGEGYSKVILILKVISPIILIIGMSNVIGVQYLLPTGGQKQYTTSVILGAIVNFCLNILLIPNFGAIGAAMGTIAAETAVALIQLFYVRKKIKVIELLKLSKNYLLAAMLMFIICVIPNYIFNNYYLIICCKVIIGMVAYILTLLFLKDKFVLEIKNRFFTKILKRRKK